MVRPLQEKHREQEAVASPGDSTEVSVCQVNVYSSKWRHTGGKGFLCKSRVTALPGMDRQHQRGDIVRGGMARTVSWTIWGALDPREEPDASQNPHSLPFSVTTTFIFSLPLLSASLPQPCASLSPQRSLFPPVSRGYCRASATLWVVIACSCCHLLSSSKILSLENGDHSHSPAVPGNKMLGKQLLITDSICNTHLYSLHF